MKAHGTMSSARILSILAMACIQIQWGWGVSLPPAAIAPYPADTATSVALDTALSWEIPLTTPTLTTPAAVPKVLILQDPARYQDRLVGTLNAIRSGGVEITTSTTTIKTVAEMATLLADKQVLLVPFQSSLYHWELGRFGRDVGGVLRQFVHSGGLLIVCEGDNKGESAELLGNAGLINTSLYSTWLSNRPMKVASSHPITEDLPTTFTGMLHTTIFNGVGDAQVLIADNRLNKPVVAIKRYGAGNVLLVGWDYYSHNAEMDRLIANAVKKLSLSTGTDFISCDVLLGKANPPSTIVHRTYDTRFTPGALDWDSSYFWRVVAHNSVADSTGTIWSFRTPKPPAPIAPINLTPENATTITTLTPRFSWTRTENPEEPSRPVLFYTGGSYSDWDEVVLDAIRAHYTNFMVTDLDAQDTATLTAQLAGKQAFIVPPQESGAAFANLGTALGPVLRPFAQGGGLVLVCDGGTGGHAFLTNAGLMNLSASTFVTSRLAWVLVHNAVTLGVSQEFKTYLSYSYGSVGDATPIIKDSWEPRTIVAMKPYGAGNVLIAGYNFDDDDTPNQGLVLANAIKYLCKSSSTPVYDLYLGTTNPPATRVVNGTPDIQHVTPTLEYATTYYWRLVARSQFGETAGPVWSFRTPNPPLPATPSLPFPAHPGTLVPTTATLTWNPAPINRTTFTLRFGTQNPPTAIVADGLTEATWKPPSLSMTTTYYWQVTATNAAGSVTGPIWIFTTPPMPSVADPTPGDGSTTASLNPTLKWNSSTPLTDEDYSHNDSRAIAFTGHIGASDSGFSNFVAALSQSHYHIAVSTTTSEDTATLAAQLSGRETFIMPEQENWTAAEMGTFGGNIGPMLRQFVNRGGQVLVCDGAPEGGAASFLANAGLLNVVTSGLKTSTGAYIAPGAPYTTYLLDKFVMNKAVVYDSVDGAQVLIRELNTNKAMVALKTIGAGNVLLLGWVYYGWTANMGELPGQAIANLTHFSILETYAVYFGTTNPPTTKVAENLYENHWSPGPIEWSQTYYWRVVTRNQFGETAGPVWSFRADPPAPAAPAGPVPRDTATMIPTTSTLAWDPQAPPTTFNIKLGTTNPPTTQVASGLTRPSFTPAKRDGSTTYYWQVTAGNVTGTAASPVWSFTTAGPPAPQTSPYPQTNAKSVPLHTTLWCRNAGRPVRVLAFTGHSDNAGGQEYQNMLAHARVFFTNFSVTATSSESTATLAAQLSGNQVFLMPEQELWNSPAMHAFGIKMGPVLRRFVHDGGLVIACDGTPGSGTPMFLSGAELLNATADTLSSGTTAALGEPSPMTMGIPPGFATGPMTTTYSAVGDAAVLVKQSGTNKPVVACRPLGAGSVLLLGFDYTRYNTHAARMLANALQHVAGAGIGIESYDVYLGTSNPPASKVFSGLWSLPCTLPALNYDTTYYWRIVSRNAWGETPSPVWSFTTTARTALPAGEWLRYR